MRGHAKEKEIEHLECLFKTGGNLNIFQSRKLLQTGFHDHLVYEWDIYHFHLSLRKEPNGVFAKQVSQLLFVYVSSSEAIFLDVDNHSEGVFGDLRWLEILHDNFPEVIEQYEDKRVSEHFLITDLNGKDRQTLWDKGYSIGMTRVRDRVFRSPGIGRMTSGHSMIVLKQCNEIMNWIDQTSAFIEHNHSIICNSFNIDISARVKLRFGENGLEIYIELTNEVILTYPELFYSNCIF